MGKQQTAIEFLMMVLQEEFPKQMRDIYESNQLLAEQITIQAKQMEAQQIKQDVYNVCKLILSNPFEKSGRTPTELFDSYYEYKYGKDETQGN